MIKFGKIFNFNLLHFSVFNFIYLLETLLINFYINCHFYVICYQKEGKYDLSNVFYIKKI